MRRLRSAALALALLAASGVALVPAAQADPVGCFKVTEIWVPGSGQSLRQPEAVTFFDQLDERIKSPVTVNQYELGDTSEYSGARYKPVPVGTKAIRNSLEADAAWTGFLGGEYRQSVQTGVDELTSYLRARHEACGQELFVLGGYSQGAQVIGDTLPALSASLLSNVAYVSLFGDPKLFLPEGRPVGVRVEDTGELAEFGVKTPGIIYKIPACSGHSISWWRQGTAPCTVTNGSLEGRNPYLPESLKGRAGSWCNKGDGVCVDNVIFGGVGPHFTYAAPGGPISQAGREAALSVKRMLADAEADSVDVSYQLIALGTTGVDVMFVIDTTGSMSSQIEAAKARAQIIASSITALNGRVALVEYRDAYDEYVSVVRSPLSTDIAMFRAALDPLQAFGGGDDPEALLAALMDGFNTLAWKDGATKAAVVLTDNTFHNPDVATGVTLTEVAKRALEIDPVNVYPVVPDFLADYYGELATQTSGRVIIDSGDTEAALLEAVTEIQFRPVALLASAEMWSQAGDAVQFDASASYDPDAAITSYEWDFDGDSVIDEVTTDPLVSHVYATPYEGLAEVRVKSADGGVANAISVMHVLATGLDALLPGLPSDVSVSGSDPVDGVRTAVLRWAAPTGGGPITAWKVTTSSGDVLGYFENQPVMELSVGGVPNEDVALTVQGLNESGSGESVTVALNAAADQQPETSPPTPSQVPSTPPAETPSSTSPVETVVTVETVEQVATDRVPLTERGTTPLRLAETGVTDTGRVLWTAICLLLLGLGLCVVGSAGGVRTNRQIAGGSHR